MRNKICQWLAYRIPKRLRYFIVIDGIAKATSGEYSSTNVSDLNVMELVKRLGNY